MSDLVEPGVRARQLAAWLALACATAVAAGRSQPDPDWFAAYRELAEIDAFVDELAARDPDVVRVRRLGTSVEGRPIRALELSRGAPIRILIDGGLHAREWI